MTHAGFWVDGAVRRPEARHGNTQGLVFLKWKDHSDIGTALSTSKFTNWSNAYWLDTTPRESLTPEELFSVLKVIWPKCEVVFRPDDGAVVEWQVNNHSTENQAAIEWGNLTQYPPPVEPQWIEVTRKNIGQYLFRECRYRDSESFLWKDGCVVGWDVEDDCCLVDCDIDSPDRVMKFVFVEVQNAPAP